ncbi:MAG: copper homeostasis protein CutC [Erysipelotrichaceae bacterium]
MEYIVEICCGGYLDAINAEKGGAKRIELNCALFMGGLTPSVGMLRLVKMKTKLKVIAMVRPRGGGFCYNDEDYETMLNDCEILLENGADGIAFGILTNNCHIDVNRCKRIVDIIKSFGKEVVFHRAFDCVDNPYNAIETLISLKVDRVLTSGLTNRAINGLNLIKTLQNIYGDHIEILVGSGVNSLNAKEIINFTNINQIHSSCKMWEFDETTSQNNVGYGYGDGENESKYEYVSEKLVKELVESICL